MKRNRCIPLFYHNQNRSIFLIKACIPIAGQITLNSIPREADRVEGVCLSEFARGIVVDGCGGKAGVLTYLK